MSTSLLVAILSTRFTPYNRLANSLFHSLVFWMVPGYGMMRVAGVVDVMAPRAVVECRV